MRTPNKVIVGLMGAGILAASYKAGMVNTANALIAAEVTPLTPTDTAPRPSATPTPTPSESSTSSSSSNSSSTKKNNSSSTSTSNNQNTGTNGSTTTPTDPGTTPVTPPSDPTQDGDAVSYRFGTVQVRVTKSGSTITDVTMLISGATGGRQQVFPTLISWALSANGSSFGNYSGATFTTQAFKKSLDSALAKF